MKKVTILGVLAITLLTNFVYAQSIQNIIDQVSNANLQLTVNELSGEQSTIINGTEQTITSRVESNNDLAATYIEERLQALPNLSVTIQDFNTNGKNVIATQLGHTNPEEIYLVCAHYDSVTTFCADDNATGVAAVLEIARILSTQCLDKTIVYALWDEEEIGLLGANFYAQQAADTSNGNTRANILGVINMDMIGFDGDAPGTPGDNQFDIDVRPIANSLEIKDDLLAVLNSYTFDLSAIVVNPGTTASDHSRFWNQGYAAVLVGESWETNDQTPNYHTAYDRVVDIDFQYMTEITKLITAYMITKAGLVNLDNTVTATSTQLTANALSTTYQWINCDTDSPILGATSQVFTPLTNGNYAVLVGNGICDELSACFNFNVLATAEFLPTELTLFPNPVVSVLTIENPLLQNLSLTLRDITGKHITTQNSEKEYITMNLEANATGIYFVTIASKLKSSTFKIVKE